MLLVSLVDCSGEPDNLLVDGFSVTVCSYFKSVKFKISPYSCKFKRDGYVPSRTWSMLEIWWLGKRRLGVFVWTVCIVCWPGDGYVMSSGSVRHQHQ